MKNEKLIAGLKEVATGLENIIEALEENTPAASTPSVKADAKITKKETKVEEVPEEEEVAEVAGGCPFSEEELKGMKFNKMKQEAAKLGVDCKGTREDIINRMLALGEAEPQEDEPEEEKEVKPTVKKGGLKKKEEPKEEPEEDGIAPEFMEQAEELAKDNDINDIINELKSVGITSKSKKLGVIVPLLAKALQDGLIQLDDESEDESEGESTGEDFDITPDTWFSNFDLNGVNDPDKMKEDRKDAVEALMQEIIDGIQSGSITEKDIQTYIETFANEAETDALGEDYEDEDLIGLYVELRKNMIDDEGERHEPKAPYEVGEEYYCCGHPLKYDGKKKKFICETCGESYDAE